MNRSKRSSKSLPPENDTEERVSHGLPPNGRPSKGDRNKSGGGTEAAGSSAISSSSYGSGEKKKKFSFFSNLFKSNKTNGSAIDGGSSGHTPATLDADGLTSSSSYESVNSVDTTSSFTFVSSKKFRGKGHKGKRIPVDDTTLPRPSSSCSSSSNNVLRPGEKGNAMNKTGVLSSHPKKLGTLSRIGMKMGLKKKYNLQSCESLEHLGSMPRPLQQKEQGKKSSKKSAGSGPVSPRSSVVIEDNAISGGGTLPYKTGNKSHNNLPSNESKGSSPLKINQVTVVDEISRCGNGNENHTDKIEPSSNASLAITGSTSKAIENENATKCDSTSNSSNKSSELSPISTATLTKPNEPIPSTSKSALQGVAGGVSGPKSSNLTPSGYCGYTSDPNTNTWSSSTKKKRAPAPPTNKSPISSDMIQIPGKSCQEVGVKNVELKSMKQLNDNDVSGGVGVVKVGAVGYPSYPSGALRRNKSKDKSHNRPYSLHSCSCSNSNSIFAHHSKYQKYHQRCCSDCPHASSSTSNSNTNTLGRSHVKGKKKAPPPPNPFGDPEAPDSSSSKKDKNPENPYGNPFLDDGDGNDNDMHRDAATVSKTNTTTIENLPTTTLGVSSSSLSLSPQIINNCSGISTSATQGKIIGTDRSNVVASVAAIYSRNAVQKIERSSVTSTSPSVAVTVTTSSLSHPISSSSTNERSTSESILSASTIYQEVVPIEDEITQNILNDRQEQEQISSGHHEQVSLPLPVPTPGSFSTSSTTQESSPSTSKSNSSSNSKRLFNFSRNRNSNSHLQSEESSQKYLETLLNSSPTLMAQARTVDNQVNAQLQGSNSKQQSTKLGLFTPKSNKNFDTTTATGLTSSNSVVPLSPPLSPKSPSPSDDSSVTKAVAPRPWYKRSISISKSPTTTKAKSPPIRPTITHLPKFSDLDREAHRIVEENKRKSAEIAFNQNARDLINIFNTTFTSASCSTTTSSVTVASIDGGRGSAKPLSTSSIMSASTSNLTTTYASSSKTYLNAQVSKPQECSIDQRNVAVVQPQKNNQTSTTQNAISNSTAMALAMVPSNVSSSAPASTGTGSNNATATVSPSIRSTSSSVATTVTSTSQSIPAVDVNSSVGSTSLSYSFSTTTAQGNAKSVICSAFKPANQSITTVTTTSKPSIGEVWSCPRCTLRNPAWRGLCEACYCRKLVATSIHLTNPSSSTSTNVTANVTTSSISTSISSITTMTTTASSCTAFSASSTYPTGPCKPLTKTASGTQTENLEKSSIMLSKFQPPSQQKIPPCENFLSQLPNKNELLQEEKLRGIKLNNNASTSQPEQDDELDIEKLRNCRLAFFAKEKQEQNQIKNLNIKMDEGPDESDISLISNTNQNILSGNAVSKLPKPISQRSFDDGEDNSIDDLIFHPKIQNAPSRPPKNTSINQASNPVISPISQDIGPNFEILLEPVPPSFNSPLQSTNNNGSAQPLPVPIFRYRPMLDPISETDANYYSIREVDNRIYQNWHQPPQTLLENESLVGRGSNATSNTGNHFNSTPSLMSSPNLHNTSAVHPLSYMKQNNASPEDPLASPSANFRLFSSPISSQTQNNDNNNAGFDLGSAFASNSHFLNSGFTSESEQEVDSDMDRRHRYKGYHNRDRDNRYWNGHNNGAGGSNSGGGGAAYSGDRNLSYDDYRRSGAIPKGYGYPNDLQQRRLESGGGSGPSSNSDSGRRRHDGYFGGGRNHYRDEDDSHSFSESSENSMADNPLMASKLLRKLEWAITHGEHILAASLAHDLALLKVNCVVAKPNTEPITIRVYVEDRFMQQGPFLVQVLPNMTLKDLKSKIEGDWGIPAGFQKWILGKKIAEDDRISLADYYVVQNTMAFLYLVTPQIDQLGANKVKAISPPPPPLPKKPTSPTLPSAPLQQLFGNRSENSGGCNHSMPMNQLEKNLINKDLQNVASPSPTPNSSSPKKVTSSAQTDNAIATPKETSKPPMSNPPVIPVESQPNRTQLGQAQCTPLYERPSSPTRGERPSPMGKIVPKESIDISLISQKVDEPRSSHQPKPLSNPDSTSSSGMVNKSIELKSASQVPEVSGQKITDQPKAAVITVTAQSPTRRSTPNAETNVPISNTRNHSPVPSALSLHAKLANLRLAAEQAFGKSFSIAQSQQQPSSCQGPSNNVGNIMPIVNSGNHSAGQNSPSSSTQSKVSKDTFSKHSDANSSQTSQPSPTQRQKQQSSKVPNSDNCKNLTNMSDPQKKTVSQNERRQVSKPEQSIITPPQTYKTEKEDKASSPKPGTSKSAMFTSSTTLKPENVPNFTSFPAAAKIEPVPKPRARKSVQLEVQTESETEKIINVAPQSSAVKDTTLTTKEIPKEKVEGFCQTTLPFPTTKSLSFVETSLSPDSLGTSSSTSSALTNQTTSRPQLPPPDRVSTPVQYSSSPTPGPPISTNGSQFKESSVIIGNVLVTPIINHVLLGTSALLRALSPQPNLYDNTTTTEAVLRQTPSPQSRSPVMSPPTHVNKNPILTIISEPGVLRQPSPTPASQASNDIKQLVACNNTAKSDLPMPSPQPLPLPPTSNLKLNQPKPFQLPYFMQQRESYKKPSTPPSKRKNSDSSIINMAISSTGSENKKSAIAVGTNGIFADEGKESNIQTYLSMLQMMEKQDLIMTMEEFECPVCITPVLSGDGVTLRDCLHTFCKDCLIGAVQYAEDSEVKCPFRDTSYSCNSSIQEREIKALVPQEVFEKYLTRSVKLAERKMMNTFHCKTTDCTGWCIFEDHVNVFKCPVCQKKNCITCSAIHDAMDCQQYQRQMAIAAETDEDAKSSRLMLEKMIQRNEALECPACHVVLLKKWGCDWVRCSYCKTEICWVTKGFRWGPGGKGDMSGGCKCGVNGIRCHPKCTYCH